MAVIEQGGVQNDGLSAEEMWEKGKAAEHREDYAKAAEWYRKAADLGYAPAQFSLGFCFYDGNGVAQDYAKAVEWWGKATNQVNTNAQKILSNLGEMW